jgi:SAM-dependent methyltransferase
MPERILDIACGSRKVAGAIGIDWSRKSQADVLADLSHTVPFKEGSFDRVVTNHFIEHLPDTPAFMREAVRVLKPGGLLEIRTTHYTGRSAWGHIEHRRTFSAAFAVSAVQHSGLNLACEAVRLHWIDCNERNRCLRNRLLSAVGDRLANLNTMFGDMFVTRWLGGFNEVYFRFRKMA